MQKTQSDEHYFAQEIRWKQNPFKQQPEKLS